MISTLLIFLYSRVEIQFSLWSFALVENPVSQIPRGRSAGPKMFAQPYLENFPISTISNKVKLIHMISRLKLSNIVLIFVPKMRFYFKMSGLSWFEKKVVNNFMNNLTIIYRCFVKFFSDLSLNTILIL